MSSFLSLVWAPLWAFLQPYVVPILSLIAGEEWRKQYEEVIRLEAERDAQKEALDLSRIDVGPVSGSAARLRDSKWNRK